MRAFAVLLVVVAHAGIGHIVPGGSGVTIFFSISGFIITYLLLRERDKTGGFSLRDFYFRRALKIGPPLIAVLVIPTLVFSYFGPIDWGDFFAQVFFYFNWVYVNGTVNVLSGTTVVWSLSIEEQFYIAFALFWVLAVRSRHWRAIVSSFAILGVVFSTVARFMLAADQSQSHRIYYGSDTRLDGIAFGVLAAVAYHFWQSRGSQQSRVVATLGSDWTLVAAVLVYVASLVVRDEWFRDTFRYTLQSLAACAVILYGLLPGGGPLRAPFYSVSRWRVVELVGLASYSIYLVHLVIIYVFDVVIANVRWWAHPALAVHVAVTSVLGILVGIMVYKLVEVPAHSMGAQMRNKFRALSHQSI